MSLSEKNEVHITVIHCIYMFFFVIYTLSFHNVLALFLGLQRRVIDYGKESCSILEATDGSSWSLWYCGFITVDKSAVI